MFPIFIGGKYTRQPHFKRVQNVDDVAVDHPGGWYCRNVKRDVVRIGVFINGLFYFYYDLFVLTRLFRRVIRHHLYENIHHLEQTDPRIDRSNIKENISIWAMTQIELFFFFTAMYRRVEMCCSFKQNSNSNSR